MANELTRVGYGQVEPNHLSAQRTGQIYAQLPLSAAVLDGTGFNGVLENGVYLKYDYAAVTDTSGNVISGEANLTGAGEWLLVYNEEKLYDATKQMHRDFAMLKTDAVDGVIVPRLFKTNVGDIYTTNCVNQTEANVAVVGAYLTPGTDGYLHVWTSEPMKWQVVKLVTMPDGQAAVKIMRIA